MSANQKVRDMLTSMDITLLNQGVIKGINAAILSEARRRGLDLMSIMVEADPRWPDARAAATLIETLNKLLPTIDLPHQPLLEEAELLESQIKAMMEGATDAPDVSTSNSMYG